MIKATQGNLDHTLGTFGEHPEHLSNIKEFFNRVYNLLISLNSPFPAIILFGTEESDTLARKIKHRHSTSTVQFNTMSSRGPSLQEYLAAKSETQLRNYLFKMEGGVARLCHHHYILLVGFNSIQTTYGEISSDLYRAR